MKRYSITVNGNLYDVAVEEVAPGAAPVAPAPVSAPTSAANPTPVAAAPTAPAAPAAAATSAQGGHKLSSPMPGTILDVKVNVGDTVSHGQALLVLEAMKMENDICSDKDGVIASINVRKGDTVDTGTLLVTIN